jgi:seryl-tRNA synthetase
MLDINYIRENADIVKKACADKKMSADIDRLLRTDGDLKAANAAVDELRTRRNVVSKAKEKTPDIIEEGRRIKTELAGLEEKQKALRDEFDRLMLHVPGIPADGVPIGAGEEDNVELRRVGTPKSPELTPKDHIEIMEARDMVDIPRGVKVAGSRSYFLKNGAALLEMAICRMVMDMLVKRGYTPMIVPQMVRYGAMEGTGYFPIGLEQAYAITEDELYLIGTSEVPLVCFHQDEMLTLGDLPKRFAGFSTCYRREAGTYGKDTRGLYRVHQFQKVEQVAFCEADADKQLAIHNEILRNTEDILQALELPYRVCAACTAELGIGQIRKHEVETWMPSRNAYCETHSCSSFNDFQARRAGIRYRDENGRPRFVYTLNNTAIASPRILIPLLENHQQADGSIYIPAALRPYMGGVEFL